MTGEDQIDYEDANDDQMSYSNEIRYDNLPKHGLRDMKIWTQPDILVTFIKLYESEPCLWKIKSKDYGNRLRREIAYSRLLAFCQSKDNTVNLDFVKSKINSIRTSYRKELNKITKSMQPQSSKLYVPKLWYYPHLDFLRDYVSPRPNLTNAEIDMDRQLNHIPDEIIGQRKRGIDDEEYDHNRKSFHSSGELDNTLDDNEYVNSRTEMLNDHESDMLKDKFDNVGKGVAELLRRMNQPQQLFAENVINRALFLGLLGRLNSASDIQTTSISDDDTVPFDS